MSFYTSVAAFLFSALALIVRSGHSAGMVMLTLGSIAVIWKRPAFRLNSEDWRIILVFAAYFAVALLLNLIHGEKLREYDGPFRFILAIASLGLLLTWPPNSRAFWSGIATGAILAGIFAGWQVLAAAESRAGGHTNPIQYGNISALLGMLCLAGLAWAQSQSLAKVWSALLLTGAAMGILGSIFTGSRGSWIAIPVCLAALYRLSGTQMSRKLLAKSAAAIAVIFAVAYAVPATGVKVRMNLIPAETQEYFHAGEAETSLGARFEMWRTGLMIFPEHPLLGWGKKGYMAHAAELAKEGKIDPVVTQHSHLHNEYLDALVKRGIPGLAAVLALYLVPLLLFAGHAKRANSEARIYAVSGVLLCLGYMSFGLTQSFLTHDDGVTIFAFMLTLLWAQLRRAGSQPTDAVETA